MQRVSISVIMPVFNDEKYLPEALASFASQSLPGVELIAVDDGSTDGSGAVLEEWRHRIPGLRILTHESNLGPAAARSTAIAEARGEFVAFLDADDRFEADDALEVLYHRGVWTLADVVLLGFTRFKDDGWVELPEKHLESLKRWSREAPLVSLETQPDLATFSTTVWSKIVRRSFWEEIDLRFPEVSRERSETDGEPSKLFYEDVYTTLTLLFEAERITCCDRVLYGYRKGKPSITQKRGEETLDVVECLDRVLDDLSRTGRLPAVGDQLRCAFERKGAQYEELIRPEFRRRFVSRFQQLMNRLEFLASASGLSGECSSRSVLRR